MWLFLLNLIKINPDGVHLTQVSGHVGFDPVKIKGDPWVAKEGKVRGLKSGFF